MYMLLQPLELLLTVEESSVRTAAIDSLTKILPSLPQESVAEHLLPMVQRLGTREWFTSRISASLILPLLIPLLEVHEVEVRGGRGGRGGRVGRGGRRPIEWYEPNAFQRKYLRCRGGVAEAMLYIRDYVL